MRTNDFFLRACFQVCLTFVFLLFAQSAKVLATPFTTSVPGTGLTLPADYPEAGGVAIVLIGVNGNVYYQFSDPAGAFRGFQNSGTPAAFRGNPFTINSPISLDCGFSDCSTYFGGAIAEVIVRFTAYDGDTQPGGFDENDISLLLNGISVGSWSGLTTEATNNAGTTSFGFGTGFGNNTFDTGWFSSTNPALTNNILTTGQITTQVFDDDPNDNFWDFRRGNSLGNQDIVTVAPGYSLTKTPTPTTFTQVGDTITYEYVVTNIGSVPIRQLALTDDKIANVTCDKTVILDTNPGGTADFATCSATYQITQEDFDNEEVVNIAQATGVPDFGTLGALTETATVTGPAISPSVAIEKTTTLSAFGDVGTAVPYDITVTNDGDATLTNIVVTDPLLPGLVCQIAELEPNEELECSGSYTVQQSDVDDFVQSGTQLSNTAEVTARDPNNQTLTEDDDVTLDGPAAAPALTLVKSAIQPDFDAVGDVLQYTFVITNTGNVTFPAPPTITDTLTGGASCPAGAIAPTASITCTASHTIDQLDLDAGEVFNEATAEITVGGQLASDTDDVTVPAVRSEGITIDKRLAAASPSSFATDGVDLTYEYVVSNSGNVTLDGVTISDNRVSAVCAPDTIAPGASITCTSAAYPTTQLDVDTGGVTNIASATGTPRGGTGTITSATDTQFVPATQAPALELEKTAPPVTAGQFQTGETVTYTYTVTNTGNTTITSALSVTDDKIGTFSCGSVPLEPGLSTSCTADYQLQDADILAGTVVNEATVTDGTTTSDPVTETISPSLNPAISLTKSADVTTVSATTDVITYTFTVENSGDTQILAAQTITVDDPRVGTVDCSAQPATLDPGETFDCTATTTPTQPELDAGEVPNSATASFEFNAGGTPTTIRSNTATEMVPATPNPSFTFTKSGPATFTALNEPLLYTFSVTNTGNVTLSSVTVTDPLIPGLSCTLANIAPTASDSCTGTYNVRQQDLDDEEIVNLATAVGQPAQGGTVTETDQFTSDLPPGAGTKSAAIQKDADRVNFTSLGEQITYTFSVTNTGNQTLTNLVVTDSLDATYSCTIPSLAPGLTNTDCDFTYTVQQGDLNAGQVDNTATVDSPEITPASEDETVTGPARVASFSFDKSTGDTYAEEGDLVRFTFAVTNTGNVTLSNLQVTDTLFSPTFTCTIPSLAPGVTDNTTCTANYPVTQNDVNQGSFTNTATITADAPPGVTAPPSGSDTEVVPGPSAQPRIEIIKTASITSFTSTSDVINYTFQVTNTGNVTLTGLSVSDPALGFSCVLDDLDPNDVVSTCENGTPALAGSHNVDQSDIDAGGYLNQVTVAGQTLVGGVSVQDSDTVIVDGPVQAPSITLAKDADDLTPFSAVGDTIDYTYVITNTGNITITASPAVTDDKISNVVCDPIGTGVAPGGTLNCTATYTIQQLDLDANQVVNNATAEIVQPVIPVNPGDPAFQTISASDSETVAADQQPALTLVKRVKSTSASSYAAIGDVVTFEYVVTNSGNVITTSDITITDDRIPGTLTCGPVGLVPGDSVICEQNWTADQPALDAGQVTNTATASMTFDSAPVDSNTDQATVTAVQSSSLSVVKTLVNATPSGDFDVGVVLDYSYVVSNDGNVTISGPFTFNDNLTSPTCTPAAPATLAPGSSFTCTASYTMNGGDVALGVVNNVVMAMGSFNAAPVVSPTDNATYPVASAPALSLTKVAVNGGDVFDDTTDVITYRYTIQNDGNTGLSEDIFVTDDKIGTFLCRSSALGVFNIGATFQCSTDQTYTVTQLDLDAGEVVNEAIAMTTFAPGTANETDVQSGVATVTVTTAENPGLTVAKDVTTGDDPAGANDLLIYTITATNTGNQTLSGVTLSDPLLGPLTCTVGGAPAPANVVLLPTQALVCTGDYTVSQDNLDDQVLTNTATARGSDPMGATLTGTGTDNHPLETPNPSIQVIKEIIPDPGAGIAFEAVDQEVTFRITVVNDGNITINNLAVTDDRVPGTCNIASIAPGESDNSCQFVFTITQTEIDAMNGTPPNTFGGFLNTATATGQPANPGASPITESGDVFVRGPDQEPVFALTKTANVTEVTAAGQVITYTFTVSNIGNITLFAQPVVTDDRIGTFNCGAIPVGGLAPLEFVTCTADDTVSQADMDLGSVTNIATVESTEVPLPATPGPARATETVDAPRAPGITITKTPSVTSGVVADDVITYTYDVVNTGNVTLTNVAVSDQHTSSSGTAALPVAGDVLGNDAAPTGDSTDGAQNGVWDSLAPGDTARFTSTYTVTQQDVDTGTTLSNTASVTSQSPPGTTPPSDQVNATVNVATPGPLLRVEKTADVSGVQSPAQVNDTIVYTITVANIGNVTLNPPTVTDTLVDDNNDPLTIPTPAFVGGDGNGNSLLDVGETWSYRTTYTIDQQAIDAGGVQNTAEATATDPFNTPVDDEIDNTVDTPLVGTPRIAVTKTAVLDDGGDGQADAGDVITYTYVVNNLGNVTLLDIALVETGFGGAGSVPILSLIAGGSDEGGNPAVPDLAVGETMTFRATYALEQGDLDAAGVTNQATATGTVPGGGTVDDLSGTGVDDDVPTQTSFTPAPGLDAEKLVDGSAVQSPAQLGDVLSYTLRVRNTGNVTLSNIGVVDTMTDLDGASTALDAPFALQSGDANGNSNLDVGEIWVYTAVHTLTQSDINAGGLVNTVTVNGTDPGTNPVSDVSDNGDDTDGNTEDDSTRFELVQGPDLTVIKAVTNATGVAPGDSVTFTITASNTGNVDLSNLQITDTLTRADNSVIAGASVLPETVPDPLMPGNDAVWTLTHVLTQQDIDAGGIQNTARVTGTTPDDMEIFDVSADDDPADGNDADDPTVFDIDLAPALLVLKTADTVGLNAGETAEFTITAENTGNITLTNVVLTDTLTRLDGTALTPDSVTFVGADGAPPSDEGTLQAGETGTWRVIYTLVQEDVNAGGVQNTASVTGVTPGGVDVSDTSDDDGTGDSDPTIARIDQTPSVDIIKSASEISILFPTIYQVSFTLEVTNSGNVTQTGIRLEDDLAGFLSPALLLQDTYPIVVVASGFTDGDANPAFDGETEINTLTGNPTLEPGETGRVTITLTYSTATGQPAQPNVATVLSDQIPDPSPSNQVEVALTDSDGDGIPDNLESMTADRDGDGIPDALDYDPTGYFYCEDNGQILSGGSISVSGPVGSQSGIGTSNNITIVQDGSEGFFQFYVTAAGSYTMNLTYPPGGTPSLTRIDGGAIDATSLLPQNPAALGSGEFGDTGELADFTAAANPFFTTFIIEAGDPSLINVNIPMTNCSGTPNVLVTKTADRDTAVFGESINYTLTYTNNTTVTYNGGNFIDQLPSGLIYTPGSAQIDGVQTEPSVVARLRLVWPQQTLAPGQTITVTFSARVTGQAEFGELINTAWMTDQTGSIISNIASATVVVEPEHVFDCSDVIGKVFDDRNRNGYQDGPDGRITDDDLFVDKTGKLSKPAANTNGEPGLPGVRIATVNGTLITTDEHGRFHVSCAELPKAIGSNFTLKVDTRTLPSGYRLTTENPRVLRLTAGKMAKMNFGAALGRVVDIDLTDRAFVPGEATPNTALVKGVDGLIVQIRKTPSVLRLSYLLQKGEEATTARARLRALEKLIRQKWRGQGRYKLDIERTVKRVQ